MVIIKLSDDELSLAAGVGTRRQIEALRKGLPDKAGYDGDGWSIHIEGAAGEIAAARALGRFWGGSVNTFKKGGDVGDVQIRTRSRHDYELIVREDDRDEDFFVLVTGKIPCFHVVGWICGLDAKQPQWKRTHGNRPPAYFVPHISLIPIKLKIGNY